VGRDVAAHAQFTHAQREQLRSVIGDRAEAAVILGSGDSVSGGTYTFHHRDDDAEVSLIKAAGRGEIGALRPLGDGGVKWAPVLYGGIGHLAGENRIDRGPLRGNDIESSVTAVQFGAGAGIHFGERFAVTPTIGGLYGHGGYELDAKTSAGRALPKLDTEFDTIGVVPGMGVSYKQPVGRSTVEFSSRYAFYGSDDLGAPRVLQVGGNSHEWQNKIDVDVPLDVSIKDYRLHTGGFVSRTDLFGDMAEGLRSSYFYMFNGRLVLNTEGKVWKMTRFGLGATYVLGQDFSGFDFGIEVDFKF